MLAACLLAVGLLVGLVSGLTGIGGAAFMIPLLYVVYARFRVPVAEATVMAHATSLAVIVPTAIRGLIGYRRHHLVAWGSALPLAVVGALTAAATAPFVPYLPARALRVGFGCFLLVIAADLMLRNQETFRSALSRPAHVAGSVLLGVPVGMLSASLGIGGGVPATIGMYYLLGLTFDRLVPTSLAVITFTAAAGTLSYALTPVRGALPFGWVVGHVDVGHAVPLALGAVVTAPLGVWLNRRLPVVGLRRVLGAFLVLVGTGMIVEYGL